MPQRICIVCHELFPMDSTRTERCPPHQAEADTQRTAARLAYGRTRRAPRGSTTQRGYGARHRAERARRIARWSPGDLCAIGGEPLRSRAGLDLAHNHVNGGYLPGLACSRHNRAEGGARSHQKRPA